MTHTGEKLNERDFITIHLDFDAIGEDVRFIIARRIESVVVFIGERTAKKRLEGREYSQPFQGVEPHEERAAIPQRIEIVVWFETPRMATRVMPSDVGLDAPHLATILSGVEVGFGKTRTN